MIVDNFRMCGMPNRTRSPMGTRRVRDSDGGLTTKESLLLNTGAAGGFRWVVAGDFVGGEGLSLSAA